MTSMKGTGAVMATEEKTVAMKVCHASVCVGDAHPTNCVCPVPKK